MGIEIPKECEELRETLADANKVHTNILRGTIALTKAQAIHVAGLPADIEAQVEQLEKQIAALTKPVTMHDVLLHKEAGDMHSTRPSQIAAICNAILASRIAGSSKEEK